MNKTNEYNYVPNQVNIRIRIRIRDIRFASYPTTSESVFVSELKWGKKYYPNLIPCVSDPISSLTRMINSSMQTAGFAYAACAARIIVSPRPSFFFILPCSVVTLCVIYIAINFGSSNESLSNCVVNSS